MVDYPVYMQTIHETWLTALSGQITTAIAANPFTALSAFDPTNDVAEMDTALATFAALVAAMSSTDYTTVYAQAVSLIDSNISPDAYILARGAEHAVGLDNELASKVYPRFEAGMRDINAVMTSAFAIGRAIIETDRMDKYDKFVADMRFQADAKRAETIANAAGEMIRIHLQKIEHSRVKTALAVDVARLSISAFADRATETKAIEADQMRWPLECYKYGANMLAGIGGGTTSSVAMDGNKTARIIGSGLSGAVAGAMVGNAISPGGEGAGYGAIVGGLAGLLGGM